MEMTIESDKFEGTLAIGDNEYSWYVNSDFQLIVERVGGGDMLEQDKETLRATMFQILQS